jgi:hypothetical protein
MARTGDKKVFCVLEFAKTESILMMQQRSQTKFHTEPPIEKTIHEWYKKFQQTDCLCAVKQTGWLRPSAEAVEQVQLASFCSKMFVKNMPDT